MAKKLFTSVPEINSLPPLRSWTNAAADPVAFPPEVPTNNRVCCPLTIKIWGGLRIPVDPNNCVPETFHWSSVNDALVRQGRQSA